MSYLPIVTSILDASGARVDLKRPDGTYGPIVLKIGAGLYAEAELKGGITEVTIKSVLALNVTDIKTAAYTAQVGDLVRCDPSGGPFAVTLPPADGERLQQVAVKNVTSDTTTITVTPAGSDTIDGEATWEISSDGGALVVLSAPGMTDWMVL